MSIESFEAVGACSLQWAPQLSGMMGVAPLSIMESWLSSWTMVREGRGQRSPSVIINHSRRAAVWPSDGLDWVNDCQSTSPPPPDSLYLSHSTAKSIKQGCFNQVLFQWLTANRPPELSAWLVITPCQLFDSFSCNCILTVGKIIQMYSRTLNCAPTFFKESPRRKGHA